MLFRSLVTCATLMLSFGGAIAPLNSASAISSPSPLYQEASPKNWAQQFWPQNFHSFKPKADPFLVSQRPPAKHRNQAGWLKELNLSQEQLRKIKDIRAQYHTKLNQQRQAVQRAEQHLSELMAGNAAAEELRQKFAQVQDLKQQFADTRMESVLAIRNVLTAEQRQKLSQIIRQQGRGRRERMMEGMGEGL
jgi:Spy/CpxP family protein refolding chaperone